MLFDSIILTIAISIGVHNGNPTQHLGKEGFLTWISSFQLLAISLLSSFMAWFSCRYRNSNRLSWRHPLLFWMIISLGFIFLAADEFYEIHEFFDYQIHNFFSIKETGITDRIDDLIVALYGLVGITVLYVYREELKKHRQALSFFKYGFILFLMVVIFDVLSNRGDIIYVFIPYIPLVNILRIIMSITEDSLKIFAESYFILAFYTIFLNTKKVKLEGN